MRRRQCPYGRMGESGGAVGRDETTGMTRVSVVLAGELALAGCSTCRPACRPCPSAPAAASRCGSTSNPPGRRCPDLARTGVPNALQRHGSGDRRLHRDVHARRTTSPRPFQVTPCARAASAASPCHPAHAEPGVRRARAGGASGERQERKPARQGPRAAVDQAARTAAGVAAAPPPRAAASSAPGRARTDGRAAAGTAVISGSQPDRTGLPPGRQRAADAARLRCLDTIESSRLIVRSIRALSSAGERSLHTGEVVGSIPTAPTRSLRWFARSPKVNLPGGSDDVPPSHWPPPTCAGAPRPQRGSDERPCA